MGDTDVERESITKCPALRPKDKLGGPGAHGGRAEGWQSKKDGGVWVVEKRHSREDREGRKAAESGLMHSTIKERCKRWRHW